MDKADHTKPSKEQTLFDVLELLRQRDIGHRDTLWVLEAAVEMVRQSQADFFDLKTDKT